ncbi:sulfotransferase family protein [Runella sp.]|uniref:sulfotransferase family protein n=1 Tax=Runella sp. TaxID=1960881 RepID=UPI003D0F1595
MDIVEKKKVNLFIVGAAKCGTTSLYNYLSEHPSVFMSPVKEPHFFSEVYQEKPIKIIKEKRYHSVVINDLDQYNSLFDDCINESVIGEASTSYLWDTNAAQRIYNYNPGARIIIMLRNPIERAFSHYVMQKFTGMENLSFYDALQKDISTSNKKWGVDNIYIDLGMYQKQVEKYTSIFPKKNIKLVSFQKFKMYTKDEFDNICDFLGIERGFVTQFTVYNESKKDKNLLITSIKSFLRNKISYDWIPDSIKVKIKKNITNKNNENIDKAAFKLLSEVYASEIRYLSSEGLIF